MDPWVGEWIKQTNRTQGSSSCKACPKGKHQGATGQSHCTACVAGYFSSALGASSCLKCSSEYGSEYTSLEGSSACGLCVSDYYMNEATGECEDCPSHGVHCDDDGATLGALEVKAHWYRFTANSSEVYACPYSKNCEGGNSTAQGDQCRAGSKGPLCAVCKSDYYLDSYANTCVQCALVTNSWTFILFMCTVSALCVVLVLLLRWKRQQKRKKRRRQQETQYVNDQEAQAAVPTRKSDGVSSRTISVHWNFCMDCLSVFVVTTQTLLLLSANHEDAGGSSGPKVYATYLSFWDFFT